MFPINDTEPNRYAAFPIMTLSLIFLNSVILIIWPPYLYGHHFEWIATVPSMVFSRVGGGFITGLTSMFLHGSFFHLFSNMFGLWVLAGGWKMPVDPGAFWFFIFLPELAHTY